MATLEQLLIDTRVLSSAQITTAQRDANIRHKRLAATLIDLGMIHERRFAEWIARVTELPILDPIPHTVVAQLQNRISPQIAREYQVVPVAIDRDTLTIATMNPLDHGALELLRHSTGMRIQPIVALYSALTEVLAQFYPEDEADLTMMRRPPDLPDIADSTNPVARKAEEDETQLDRIERAIADLVDALDKLQRRVDAMDATIARALMRR